MQSLGGSLVFDHEAERRQNEENDTDDEGDEADGTLQYEGGLHGTVDTEARGVSSGGALEAAS